MLSHHSLLMLLLILALVLIMVGMHMAVYAASELRRLDECRPEEQTALDSDPEEYDALFSYFAAGVVFAVWGFIALAIWTFFS